MATAGFEITQSETILYEKKDRIAWITLNRPERMNALGRELSQARARALKDASEDDDDEEVEGLLFPNPVESNAGAALVVNAVLYYSDSNYYNGYDNSLESEWPELLNFEIEDEKDLEEATW